MFLILNKSQLSMVNAQFIRSVKIWKTIRRPNNVNLDFQPTPRLEGNVNVHSCVMITMVLLSGVCAPISAGVFYGGVGVMLSSMT